MPETSAKILKQINCEEREYAALGEFGLYPDGNVVEKNAEIIFARLDPDEISKKAEEIKQKYAAKTEKKAEDETEKKAEEITIDDFMKVEFKTATVTACEKVEKSKKLLKLPLKVGDETRTVASGIADYYKPEELLGKKVVLVSNLKPAKLCGVESQGMILCAEKDGKVCVVSPENNEIPDGATVR